MQVLAFTKTQVYLGPYVKTVFICNLRGATAHTVAITENDRLSSVVGGGLVVIPEKKEEQIFNFALLSEGLN